MDDTIGLHLCPHDHRKCSFDACWVPASHTSSGNRWCHSEESSSQFTECSQVAVSDDDDRVLWWRHVSHVCRCSDVRVGHICGHLWHAWSRWCWSSLWRPGAKTDNITSIFSINWEGRVFSTFSFIHNKIRNWLGVQKASKLVFCYHMLHGTKDLDW